MTPPPQSPQIPVKVFACPSCGASLTVSAIGQTSVVGCESCGSIVDANDENHRIVQEAKRKLKITPVIPLGSMGKFRGANYRVVGMLRRAAGSYEWDEYLLFNPTQGFRWLTEYYGHWNLIRSTKNKPEKLAGTSATHLGTKFKQFQSGNAKVIYVIGEFYWEVKVGDLANLTDYVSPPEILCLEKSQGEQIWARGEYLQSSVVKDLFKLPSVPTPKGIAPNQPSGADEINKVIKSYLLSFLAVLIVIHVGFSVTRKPRELFASWYSFVANDPEKVKVTPEFPVAQKGNVVVDTFSGLQNTWLSLDLRLVNKESGEVYRSENELSYYSGSDSDGTWTEGSTTTEAVFAGVTPGTYTLSIEPSSDATTPTGTFHIKVKSGVLYWGNFFFAIAALLILPMILWLYHSQFEYRRWENSDYPWSSYWGEE